MDNSPGVAAGVCGCFPAEKSDKGSYWFDKMKLSLPGFGNLITKLSVARFARTLGTLLENGVSCFRHWGL
ncbi:MAG: hypothetical protein R2860_13720 [Desulfobacterales bacterium]